MLDGDRRASCSYLLISHACVVQFLIASVFSLASWAPSIDVGSDNNEE